MKKPINGSVNPREMDAVKLSNYIRDTHHVYLKEALQVLNVSYRSIGEEKIALLPRSSELKTAFDELVTLLEVHLKKERELLFPCIQELVDQRETPGSGLLHKEQKDLAAEIHQEHVRTIQLMDTLRKLTHHYTPPPGSPASVKLFYAHLFNLEQDIHRHIYLEEHVLFPKMAELGVSMAGITIK